MRGVICKMKKRGWLYPFSRPDTRKNHYFEAKIFLNISGVGEHNPDPTTTECPGLDAHYSSHLSYYSKSYDWAEYSIDKRASAKMLIKINKVKPSVTNSQPWKNMFFVLWPWIKSSVEDDKKIVNYDYWVNLKLEHFLYLMKDNIEILIIIVPQCPPYDLFHSHD